MDFRACAIHPGYRDRVRSSSPRHILADLYSCDRVIELQTRLELGSYPRMHLRFSMCQLGPCEQHALNLEAVAGIAGLPRPRAFATDNRASSDDRASGGLRKGVRATDAIVNGSIGRAGAAIRDI
jgi:hypothetical protein